MINSIIGAISILLYAEFGDGYTIYAEDVEQGLREPCFFISCVSHSHDLRFGKRYFRENLFCIQYFPSDGQQVVEECHEVAGILECSLEYLNVSDGQIHGTKMHYEIVDGVLHFFVNYDCFVRRSAEHQESMEEMNTQMNVKG